MVRLLFAAVFVLISFKVVNGLHFERIRLKFPSRVTKYGRGNAILHTFSAADSLPELSWSDGDLESSEMGAWVPVGSSSCLSGLDPLEIEIMGHKFAVWHSGDEWSVVNNECPHRMAPLSLGRVEGKCLECPYHGWTFSSNGTLQSIPHLERNASLQADSRSVESYPVHLTGDLIWTFLPTSFHGESFPQSLLPEDYYHGLREAAVDKKLTFYSQDLPFSYDFLVENGLDGPAHAFFAHHRLGFDRSEVSPIPSKVFSNFTEVVSEVIYKRKGTMRLRRYAFQRPFLLTNQQPKFGGGWETALIFFEVPIQEGHSRLITTFDTLKPHPAAPDWLLHIINRKFVEGDLILHNTEIAIRSKQSAVPKYIHASSSDLSCRTWRSWWTRYGMSAAPKNTFGPASPENLKQLSRKELVDPWRMHTSKCSKCRKVLKFSKIVLKAGLALVWGALALVRRRRFFLCTMSLLGLLSTLIAGRLVRELEGTSHESEVGDRSYSAMAD